MFAFSNKNDEVRLAEIQVARQEIIQSAQFDKSFIIMNALAAVIASYGLLADSVSGVIGAMLVAMLLNPIVGVSLSLVDGNSNLFRQSMRSLAGGIGIVILCAGVIGILHPDIPAGKELLGRTHPNYMDLMIALAGGAVGAYAVITPRISNAVVGVAIATALVPPLCSGTIFAARQEWENAGGAFLLAFANISAIQFASSVVLWLSGFNKTIDKLSCSKHVILLNIVSLICITVLFVALGANTKAFISQVLFESSVRKVLKREISSYPGAYMSDVDISEHKGGKNIIRIAVRGPFPFSAEDVGKIENNLPKASNGLSNELVLRYISVNVMTKNGRKFDLKQDMQMLE